MNDVRAIFRENQGYGRGQILILMAFKEHESIRCST